MPTRGSIIHRSGSVLGLHFALQTAAALSDVADPLAAVDAARRPGSQHHLRTPTGGRKIQSPHDASGRLRPAATGPASRTARRGGPPRRGRNRLAATSGSGGPRACPPWWPTWRTTPPGSLTGGLGQCGVDTGRHQPTQPSKVDSPAAAGPGCRRHGRRGRSGPGEAVSSGRSPGSRPAPAVTPGSDTSRFLTAIRSKPNNNSGPPGSTSTRPSSPTCRQVWRNERAARDGSASAVGHDRVGATSNHSGLPDQPERVDAHGILGIGLGLVGTRRLGLGRS